MYRQIEQSMQVTIYIQHIKKLRCNCEEGQRIASLNLVPGNDVSTIDSLGKGKFRYQPYFTTIDKITLI